MSALRTVKEVDFTYAHAVVFRPAAIPVDGQLSFIIAV
jgi:hypothetical protein